MKKVTEDQVRKETAESDLVRDRFFCGWSGGYDVFF